MAKLELLAPIFIKWETGVSKSLTETLVKYYARAKQHNKIVTNGTFRVAGDRGGMTVVGVTATTYGSYLKSLGKTLPKAEIEKLLPKLDIETWLEIMRQRYWECWKADYIVNQSVANILVDWGWMSGSTTAIKKAQAALGLVADGVVGPITIAALNADPAAVFDKIKKARRKHFEAIVLANPSQAKFFNGWINRLNFYQYED